VGYTRHYTVAVWVGNFDGGATATLPGSRGAGPILGDLMKYLYPNEAPAPFEPPDTITTRRVCAQSGLLPSPGCREIKIEYFVLNNEPKAKCGQHLVAADRYELPATYAQWLKQRYDEGRASRFRLAGYNPDLNSVFAPANEQTMETYTGPVHIGGEDAPSGDVPETEIRITYPLDQDRYVLEPGQSTLSLRLEATVKKAVKQIIWLVDSMELGTAGPPYSFEWNAGRGRHRVQAVDEFGYGETIEVTVE
jgi:penicillin-binding protein 1C